MVRSSVSSPEDAAINTTIALEGTAAPLVNALFSSATSGVRFLCLLLFRESQDEGRDVLPTPKVRFQVSATLGCLVPCRFRGISAVYSSERWRRTDVCRADLFADALFREMDARKSTSRQKCESEEEKARSLRSVI